MSFVAYNGVQRIRPVVTNRKIIRARREVGNKCRLYKHFVVAAKNERVGREMAILLCEVPLNKDREREREKERQQQQYS